MASYFWARGVRETLIRGIGWNVYGFCIYWWWWWHCDVFGFLNLVGFDSVLIGAEGLGGVMFLPDRRGAAVGESDEAGILLSYLDCQIVESGEPGWEIVG